MLHSVWVGNGGDWNSGGALRDRVGVKEAVEIKGVVVMDGKGGSGGEKVQMGKRG